MILIKLKEYIRESGVKQQKIAKELKVTPQHLSAVINKKTPLSDRLESDIRKFLK